MKALRRAGLAVDSLSTDEICGVFRAFAEGRLAREGVLHLLTHLARGVDAEK